MLRFASCVFLQESHNFYFRSGANVVHRLSYSMTHTDVVCSLILKRYSLASICLLHVLARILQFLSLAPVTHLRELASITHLSECCTGFDPASQPLGCPAERSHRPRGTQTSQESEKGSADAVSISFVAHCVRHSLAGSREKEKAQGRSP